MARAQLLDHPSIPNTIKNNFHFTNWQISMLTISSKNIYTKLATVVLLFTLRTTSMASEMNPNQPLFFCTAASAAESAVATAASARV